MQKILITTTSLELGGKTTSLLNLLNIIDYTKYSVDLLLMSEKDIKVSLPKEVKVQYYKSYMLKPLKLLYNLKKNINVTSLYDRQRFAFKKKYDIAIAYDGFDNYMDMVAASVKSKKKIIWVHDDIKGIIENKKGSSLYKIMYKLMSYKYRYFDEIICVSKTVKDNMDLMFKEYKNKTKVINNIVDADKIRKLALKETPITLSREYNIIAMGRLSKNKNFDKIIELHKKLVERGLKVKTYIIGDGEEFLNLSNKIRNLKLTNSIMLLGGLVNPYNVLTQANLLISMSSYEAFGYNLLEAAVLDVPFISTPNAGAVDACNNILSSKECIISTFDDMYIELVKNMKKTKRHLNFDDKTYNKVIKNQIKELLEINEN